MSDEPEKCISIFAFNIGKGKLLVYILDYQTIYSLSVTLSTIKVRYKYGTIIPLKANNYR